MSAISGSRSRLKLSIRVIDECVLSNEVLLLMNFIHVVKSRMLNTEFDEEL